MVSHCCMFCTWPIWFCTYSGRFRVMKETHCNGFLHLDLMTAQMKGGQMMRWPWLHVCVVVLWIHCSTSPSFRTLQSAATLTWLILWALVTKQGRTKPAVQSTTFIHLQRCRHIKLRGGEYILLTVPVIRCSLHHCRSQPFVSSFSQTTTFVFLWIFVTLLSADSWQHVGGWWPWSSLCSVLLTDWSCRSDGVSVTGTDGGSRSQVKTVIVWYYLATVDSFNIS